MKRTPSYSAQGASALGRLCVWAFWLGWFWLGNVVDRVCFSELRRGKTRRERAAGRLRRAFEHIGGTAIKIGQQAAMRLDLLPFEYCNELAKMLDDVPPFRTDQAVATIERATQRPIHELFEAFDPNPVGSASVSCVYHAVRLDGRDVAVKVRRPGIGPLFLADCRALGLLLNAAEALSLLRPGLTKNVVVEFRDMLVDELDFVKEARNAELFRRRAKKSRMRFVSVPRTHFDCSNEEVLVTDFVKGIWLTEFLSAVECKDAELLAHFERLNIVPRRVAERLIEVNHFTIAESILFHSDPHPANIVVFPDSKLTFIDFGACGSYTEKERVAWRRLLDAQSREDVGEMVQCALAILEPLPPIDIDEFTKKLEIVFWQDLYAFRSKHAEWWERTSAHIWISFLGLANEYSIPMNLNTLRMIRSTLLYDTIAARLYKKIDVYSLYQRYLRKAGARAKKRLVKRADKTLIEGPPKPFWLRVEQLSQLVEKAFYVAQRTLDAPPFRFALQVAKVGYMVQLAVRTVLSTLVAATVLVGVRLIQRSRVFGSSETVLDYGIQKAFDDLQGSVLFWGLVVLIVVINFRKMSLRLQDRQASEL